MLTIRDIVDGVEIWRYVIKLLDHIITVVVMMFIVNAIIQPPSLDLSIFKWV